MLILCVYFIFRADIKEGETIKLSHEWDISGRLVSRDNTLPYEIRFINPGDMMSFVELLFYY